MSNNGGMTLTEFLEARIAEDEERASSGWARLGDSRWETTNEGQDFLTPSAVLAECAAKRAIIDEYTGSPSTCQVLAHLATVYSEHPDYDKDWAP